MSFDFENAVQQGINTNPNTNERNIDAKSLEIQFNDGYGELRVLDENSTSVLLANADGYLSISGNAEIGGGNVLVKGVGQTNTEFITLQDQTDQTSIFLLDSDPNSVTPGSKGSIGLNYNDGYVYVNRDDATTWERLAFASETASGSLFTQKRGLEINGAVLNGRARVSTDGGTPSIDFSGQFNGRASWSIPVPADWDGYSDINVTAIWSAKDNVVGNVLWRLEYKVLALGELSSSAAATDDFAQTTSGTTDALQSTGVNLLIPGASIVSTDALIVINLVRLGSDVADTYNNSTQVHLVQYSYSANNIIN